jgi:RNA polymerase sigma-70 factor (ECF subfamily)
MEGISDEALAEGFSAGAEEHFEVLINRYEGKVFSLAKRLVGSEGEAEEVLQTVFLDAFEQFRSYTPASVQTWFYRAALGAAVKKLQAKAREQKEALDKAIDAGQEPRSDSPQPTPPNPVEKAITKLPQEYREVFCLHDVHGVEESQIAEIMLRQIDEVAVLLHRARQMVRRTVARHIQEGGGEQCCESNESAPATNGESAPQSSALPLSV